MKIYYKHFRIHLQIRQSRENNHRDWALTLSNIKCTTFQDSTFFLSCSKHRHSQWSLRHGRRTSKTGFSVTGSTVRKQHEESLHLSKRMADTFDSWVLQQRQLLYSWTQLARTSTSCRPTGARGPCICAWAADHVGYWEALPSSTEMH